MSITYTIHELMNTWSRCNYAGQCHMQRIPSTLHSNRTLRRFTSSSVPYPATTTLHREPFERISINCLVQAGLGHQIRCKRKPSQIVVPETRRVAWVQPTWSYNRLPLLIREDIQTVGMLLPKRKLLSIVDDYGAFEKEDYRDDKPSNTNSRLGGTRDMHSSYMEAQRKSVVANLGLDDREAVERISRDISTLMELSRSDSRASSPNPAVSIERMFQQYRGLPDGRIALFHWRTRQDLMKLLVSAAGRDKRITLKFLSVLDELQRAQLPIPRAFSNAAIHLVGKSLGRVTSRDVEVSLRRWTLMEASLGIQGDIYTFNILLDVAVKGEQYALAEMILDEMKQRGIKPDRITRIGMIYYYGVRGDGDGVRRAYRQLVHEDIIVDTVVLNCVIASLLRAGEAEAAHHVYLRMKDFSDTSGRQDGHRLSGRNAKAIQKLLKSVDAKDVTLLQQLQDISPDEKTFLVFVDYHIDNTGDLERIAQYLNDMQAMGIAPSGKVFVDLFRGFFHHGGGDFTWWTVEKLEKVWLSLQLLVDGGRSQVYWGKWMVIWILRAYARCCGHDAALQKWSHIKLKWSQAEEHESLMLSVIHYALPWSAHSRK